MSKLIGPVIDEGAKQELVTFRRSLHTHPEVSGTESETRKRILAEIGNLGGEITTYPDCNGVMLRVRNGEGKCMAVRADMDALPIQECSGLSFASKNPGVMHACGHDVHMALACASARYLASHKEMWHGEARFLFEPMEETVGGARLMAQDGCMEGVDAIIGQHVNPSYPAGTYFCKPGYVSGSSDESVVHILGTGCHGAYPERGVDAIVIAAQVISSLQSLVSRNISPFDPVALTFGTIAGGSAKNIVCDRVTLTGTLRTLRSEVRSLMHDGIRRIAGETASAFGGRAEVEITPGYGAVRNDDALYALVEACAEKVFGKEHMVLREAPSLGVESICYFFDHAPGVYYDIGSGVGTALHTPTFCVDEDCLFSGLEMQLTCLLSYLGE